MLFRVRKSALGKSHASYIGNALDLLNSILDIQLKRFEGQKSAMWKTFNKHDSNLYHLVMGMVKFNLGKHQHFNATHLKLQRNIV